MDTIKQGIVKLVICMLQCINFTFTSDHAEAGTGEI